MGRPHLDNEEMAALKGNSIMFDSGRYGSIADGGLFVRRAKSFVLKQVNLMELEGNVLSYSHSGSRRVAG